MHPICIQGKPGQGEKYLQNTYYVSGTMFGMSHTSSHLIIGVTLGAQSYYPYFVNEECETRNGTQHVGMGGGI